MPANYETIVTVSEWFIENILEKTLNWDLGIEARLEDDQFIFFSKDQPLPGIEELKKLSQQYQNAVFETRSTSDLEYEVADVFEISNGEILSEQKDIWYRFQYDSIMKSLLKSGIISQFESEAREYFNMIDNYLWRKHDNEYFNMIRNGMLPEMDYYYQADNSLFNARRKGLRLLDVIIDIDDVSSLNLLEEKSTESRYKDVPF